MNNSNRKYTGTKKLILAANFAVKLIYQRTAANSCFNVHEFLKKPIYEFQFRWIVNVKNPIRLEKDFHTISKTGGRSYWHGLIVQFDEIVIRALE